MKKSLLITIAILLLISLMFTGCSNVSSDDSGVTMYDLLLQMPKTYVGESDKLLYTSLKQYETEVFSNKMIKGALATIECVDTVFYITVRHDGEDIMVSGKAVAKCKIVDLGKTFNDYGVRSDAVLEFVQDYYVIPTNHNDKVDMFKSFGADFKEDSTGAIIEMEIKDGDYILEIQENVDYTLMLHNDTLPMESGKKYTCAISSYDSLTSVQYLSPLEDEQRYEVFQISQSTLNIANEIKREFVDEK